MKITIETNSEKITVETDGDEIKSFTKEDCPTKKIWGYEPSIDWEYGDNTSEYGGV